MTVARGLILPDAPVALTRYNPPGRGRLSYGGGDFLASFDRLLVRLPQQLVPDADGRAAAPFANFNVEAGGDWTLALLHAWAAVTHVIGFYQERIVNEGYLRTAGERLSLVQLARTVGYEMQPGLSARALPAFTVLQPRGEPPTAVFIPRGTAIQSVPPPKSGMHLGNPMASLPQIFETSEDFLARAEWNLLTPAARREPGSVDLPAGSASIRVTGHRADLRAGDRLLIVGKGDASEPVWRTARVGAVRFAPTEGFTALTWEYIPPAADAAPLAGAEFFVLRQRAVLLPYTATGIYRDWPADAGGALPRQEGWWPGGAGLPREPVECLAGTARGNLLAATKRGLYRSTDGGETWQAAGAGMGGMRVTALTAAEDAALYAGTDKGEILQSVDEGETWRPTARDPIYIPPSGLSKLVPAAWRSSGHLPVVVVSSLAAYRDGRQETLAAGTDSGVFLSGDRGRTWQPANLVFPGFDHKTGLAQEPVAALAVTTDGRRKRLVAGTRAGVFPIRRTPAAGPILLLGLLLAALYRFFSKDGLTKDLFGAGLRAAQRATNEAGTALADIGKRVADLGQQPLGGPLADALTPLITRWQQSDDKLAASLKSASLPGLPAPLQPYPVVWVLVDAAVVAAILGALVGLWWLAWRALCNRPARRIAAPAAKPAVTTATAKAPDLKALPAPRKHPPTPVRDLHAREGELLAATASGLYRSAGPRPDAALRGIRRVPGALAQLVFPGLLAAWQRVDATDAPPDLAALALPDADAAFALSTAGEAYRYSRAGGTWQPGRKDAVGVPLPAARAALAFRGGLLAGGEPPKAKTDARWSPWQAQRGALDLDAARDDIAAGSWLVLEPAEVGNGAPAPRLLRVRRAEPLDSADALRRGAFTRVTVAPDPALLDFDRTASYAWFASERLPVYDDAPVFGDTLTLTPAAPGLRAGHRIIAGGKRLRARLIAPPEAQVKLVAADNLRSAPIVPGESLIALAPPEPGRPWRLLNREGLAGEARFEGDAGAYFALEPPHADDPEVHEAATVRDVSPDAETVTLLLAAPLAAIYERTTFAVRANVAPATHGSTVAGEVLGTGDGSRGNQRFPLRQGPLSYLSAGTAEGHAAALEVTVAGVRWQQAPYLFGLPRDARAYVVRHDERGAATLTFGDGRAGARLPSAREEVRATYRIGVGAAGNVAADSLTQLRAAPPGLSGVTNPIAAGGGIDPEGNESIRANAALGLAALQRIVSLTDYEDFVRAFPGIGRAQARPLRARRGELLHVTIADADGKPVPGDSPLFEALARAVERARVAAVPALRIASYEPVYFDLGLRLFVRADERARAPLIEQQAGALLAAAFAFPRREFGQEVSAGEIISLVQSLAGVAGVEITRLAYHAAAAAGAPPLSLAAQVARWQGADALPAQMLLLNTLSADGLTITTEFTP